MAGISAPQLEADFARGDIKLIVDNHQLARSKLEPRQQGLDGFAAFIHESLRFCAKPGSHIVGKPRAPQFAKKFLSSHLFNLGDFLTIRKEGVNKGKAAIVPCSRILLPGIAQAHNQSGKFHFAYLLTVKKPATRPAPSKNTG